MSQETRKKRLTSALIMSERMINGKEYSNDTRALTVELLKEVIEEIKPKNEEAS